MAKSSKVTMSLTMRSSDIIPTGLDRSVSMTLTASDDTSEFGKMVIGTSYEQLDKSAIADRAYVYIKNTSSTSTVVISIAMDESSDGGTSAGNHKGPIFSQLAVGEFALLPYKDVGAQASSDLGIHVKGSAAGEIEYLIFELD
jgi:hypothetical protein